MNHDIPSHQFVEGSELMNFDFFKLLKENPRENIEKISILPKKETENPCLNSLTQPNFSDIDELM